MTADRRLFPDPPTLPARIASLRGGQARLFCLCGESRLLCCGLCSRCYWQEHHSRRHFAGQRDAILARDGRRCRGCGSDRTLVVHHRHPGIHHRRWLITLCAACHARIHRLGALRHWVEPALVLLWEEQHPGKPLQLQFSLAAAG